MKTWTYFVSATDIETLDKAIEQLEELKGKTYGNESRDDVVRASTRLAMLKLSMVLQKDEQEEAEAEVIEAEAPV